MSQQLTRKDKIIAGLCCLAFLFPCWVFWRVFTETSSSAPVQTAPQPVTTSTNALAAVQAVLDEADPDRSTFAGVSSEGYTLTIVVTTAFLAEPKSVRLEAAKNLHTIWVQALGVYNPDDARIRLVTASGERVGGSAAIAGGIIEVDD